MKNINHNFDKFGDSSLNCWFRQQGNSIKKKPSQQQQQQQTTPNQSQIFLPTIIKSNKNKKNHYDSTLNIKKSISRKRNDFYSENEYLMNGKKMKKYSSMLNETPIRNIQTPFPTKSFYSRCIEDVVDSNMPENMNLKRPRELEYIRNMPFYKYITFGCGESCENFWQIKIN